MSYPAGHRVFSRVATVRRRSTVIKEALLDRRLAACRRDASPRIGKRR